MEERIERNADDLIARIAVIVISFVDKFIYNIKRLLGEHEQANRNSKVMNHSCVVRVHMPAN